MADSSRVEELRKRYHENPRRFFAPLANEYRKGGLLDRAILLCQKHLGEQPGNMNGLIVYGQTLFESGRHEEARGPFEAALELDPENLIALRHLGDIARLAGDNANAQRWYGRVLDADRRNDEVRALLDQVGGPATEPRGSQAMRPAAPAPAASPSSGEASSFIELLGNDVGDAAPAPPAPAAKTVEVTPRPASAREIESRPSTAPKTLEITPRRAPFVARTATPPTTPAASPPASPPPAQGMRRASLLDINFDFGEIASGDEASPSPKPSAPLMGAEAAEYGFASPTNDLPLLDPIVDEPHEPLLSTEVTGSLIDLPPDPVELGEVSPLAGLEAAEYEADVSPLDELESTEFSAGSEAIAPLAELETAEFHVPSHDEPLDALPGLEAFEPEVPTATPPSGELTFLDDDAITSSAAEPAILTPESMPIIDSESFGKPTPAGQPSIVTETMAELYLEQGHRSEAMEVYRKLIAQDPHDESLRERLASLEAAGAGGTGRGAPAAGDDERPSMEFDVPDDAIDEVERAPENAMLNEVSFEDLALSTPAAATPVTRAPATPTTPTGTPVTPPTPTETAAGGAARSGEPMRATPSGPTAREFFAAFAARTLEPGSAAPPEMITPPSGSWAVPAAISSLDDLFGVEVSDDDQRAANFLSGVATTSAPSGTSSFDALFASEERKPAPRNSVPRASEKLKFDQFFSSSSTPSATTPAPTPAVPAVPAVPAPESAPQPEPSSAPEPDTSAGARGDDDLDQFQGWLKGLTQ